MADFLRRLAERALGVATVAQPAIAPRFAMGPRLADESSGIPAEASVGPTNRAPSDEPPRPLRSPQTEAQRVEADLPRRPAMRDEPPRAQSRIRAETEPNIRLDDFTPRAAETVIARETLESRVEEAEPQWQPVIAPFAARPELRAEALPEKPEWRPSTVEAQEQRMLEVTRLAANQPEGEEPVLPHPTMPAIPWRGVQGPSHGRQRSHAEEPEATTPIVRVSIGRVEVRAVFPDPPRPTAPLPRSSALSLSEYLKQRDGGMR
jgi:hypothetical protein